MRINEFKLHRKENTGVDDICCQLELEVVGGEEAVCYRVSSIYIGIPDTYWGNSLRDGDPEAIELSVIKLRDAARPCLSGSHDISVGINALQILVVRLSGARLQAD